MSRKYLVALMLGAATLAAVSQFSLAQPDPNGPPAGQQGPGGPGGPGGGPGGMQGGRERMMEALRDELDIGDDAAWDALALKIDKVLEAQREARTPGMGRGPGGPGGPPGEGGQRGQRGPRGENGGGPGGPGGPGAGGPPDGGPGAGGPPADGGGQRGQGRGRPSAGGPPDQAGGGQGQRGQRGGGQGAGGPQGEPSPVMIAARDLREAVGEDGAKAEDIAAKLKAYRDAKAAADAKLAAARTDLKSAVTDPRQEAVLVLRGLLE